MERESSRINLPKQRLRIGHIAPLYKPIPPEGHAGTERVVGALHEELFRRGHDITLFASGNSQVSGRLISPSRLSLSELDDQSLYRTQVVTMTNVSNAYSRANEFDVYLDHTRYVSLPAAHISNRPVISPLHSAMDEHNDQLYQACSNVSYVALSHEQTVGYPDTPVAKVIPHGLHLENIPFTENKDRGDYLLHVGRIVPQKGTHLAIEVAKELDIPLVIAAKLDTSNKDAVEYFEEKIKDEIDDMQVIWAGEVKEHMRNEMMSKALALLHPVTWSEPFGLVMIEAMAAGCPVVGFDKGSVSEVVKDDVSGYVVQNVEEMKFHVGRALTLDRNACREYALDNFTTERMTDRYESLMYELIEKQGKKK